MEARRFYRIAIWAPIGVPAVALVCLRVFGEPIWEPLVSFVALLILSLAYGGTPYAALAAWATWRSRSLDERQMRRLALWAPVLMLIPFLPFAFVAAALDGGGWLSGIVLFGFGAMYILPLGYLYVGVVLAVGILLRLDRRGGAGVAQTL